jgi:RNA polymerase sigma factor (sigma-70 family)
LSMSTEKGNSPSFDQVYSCLFPIIFRVSYRITGDKEAAEDLCQEAFIRYMGRNAGLPDLDQTKFWLIHVVRNLSLNFEKRKQRARAAFGRLKRISPTVQEPRESEVIDEEIRSDVQTALNRLPHNLRMPLVFREYADLSYKEIGNILGLSESNVKIRIFRAREKLEKILKEGNAHAS